MKIYLTLKNRYCFQISFLQVRNYFNKDITQVKDNGPNLVNILSDKYKI